jgi:predicted alpha/beta superfamily hydrolase
VRRAALLAAAAVVLPGCAEHRHLCDPLTPVPWARIHVEDFSYPPFRGGRRCQVFLPPGYAVGTERYAVLYMLDGQLLFGPSTRWRADQTCEYLIERRQIEPIILVGIDRPEDELARVYEYTPWPSRCYDPFPGGGGDALLRAIADTLRPEIDRRFRTLTGPEHTYFAGASLGGLMAAYAAYAYDTTFGRVAAISPSYWWDCDSILGFARIHAKPAIARFYQDNGLELDQPPELLDEMAAIATSQGFVRGRDLLSFQVAGESHDPGCWGRRFPDALRFLIDHPSPF